MSQELRTRFSAMAVRAAMALAPSIAIAQEWVVFSGAAGRAEYNDNYFFTAPGLPAGGGPAVFGERESAYTVSVIPFVAASRRTEVSEVTALLSVGGNAVWGPYSEQYLSGNLGVNGVRREARSTWTGRASYARSTTLQNVIRDGNVLLALTYTDAAVASGTYDYALTDRWAIGADIGAFANRYESVDDSGNLPDDHGYNVGGRVRYAFSERTQLTYVLGYSYYGSDVTRSKVATTTIGIVHQYSPQLTLSASTGGFWSETNAKQNAHGQQQPGVVDESRENGTFFGGSISYQFSERTRFDANLSESLTPSSVGTISRSDSVGVAFSHQFSDRLTSRVGASYSRTSFPAALDDDYTDKTFQAQAGLTYQLAERWKLDAGYQYTRARYSQYASEPRSNVIFVGLAYNWPGSSFTGWLGRPTDTYGLPGAGPLSLPDTSAALPGTRPASEAGPSERFDPFTLP